MRVDLPEFHPRFPAAASSDMMNLVVREGVNRKFPGLVKYTTAVPGGTVKWLCDFLLSTGSRHLVAGTGRRFFQFNAAGPSWVDLTPTYTTGTCTNVATETTVLGIGTLWVAAGVQAGHIFQCAGHQYTITAVTDNTHLEVTPAGDGWVGAAYTITLLASESGEDHIRGAVGDDQLLICNGVDTPWKWDGVTAKLLKLGGAPPVARFISTFHLRNLLVMANISTDAQRLQNSDAANYEQWATGLAASYDFHALAGDFAGVDGGHEFLMAFLRRAIWRGAWSGTDVQIQWGQIPTQDGVEVPNSLIRLGAQSRVLTEGALTQWAYMGVGNFYLFDGESTQAIGDRIRTWVWDRLDPEKVDLVQAACIPQWHLAIWSFPARGAGVNTHSVILDYATGEWYPSDVGFSALGSYDLDAGDVTWDSLTGTLDSQTRIFDETGTLAEPVTLAADASGYLYYLAWRPDRDGGTISARRRIRLPASPRGRTMEIGELRVVTTAAPGTVLMAHLYGGDTPTGMHRMETRMATVTGGHEVWWGFNSAARHLAVVVSNAGGSEELGLVGATVRMRERNR